MNPRNVMSKPLATKADKVERRRKFVKAMMAIGHSRATSLKLAKVAIK